MNIPHTWLLAAIVEITDEPTHSLNAVGQVAPLQEINFINLHPLCFWGPISVTN